MFEESVFVHLKWSTLKKLYKSWWTAMIECSSIPSC